MSISEAWQRFGVGNGVENKEQLEERARSVLKVEGDQINCLILDGDEFLEEAMRQKLVATTSPRTFLVENFSMIYNYNTLMMRFPRLPQTLFQSLVKRWLVRATSLTQQAYYRAELLLCDQSLSGLDNPSFEEPY
jgi:hypothetical protein